MFSRYILTTLFWLLLVVWLPLISHGQLITPNIQGTILNQSLNQAINTNLGDDPLRDGALWIVADGDNTIDNIIWSNQDDAVWSFANAKNRVINILNTIINYGLGLLALVALVYLIYHGIVMLTAWGDEERYNTGLGWIKYAAIALAGIGLSWFLISLIFYIIDFIIW